MKTISEKDIRDLRRKKSVKTVAAERLKPALFHKKSKTPLTLEERQAIALEQIPIEITKVLQENNKNAVILLEMIRKIKVEPVRIPEYPKQVQKWKFDVSRNGEGFIKQITAEAI